MRPITLLAFLTCFTSVQSQQLKLVLPIGHSSTISDIRTSPDDRLIYTAGADNKLIIWDLKTGLQLRELSTGRTSVEKILINPDGSRLLGGRVYNKRDSMPLWDKQGNIVNWLTHPREITSAHFFPDGRHILTSGYATTLRIWNATTGQIEKEINVGDELLWSTAISSDGKTIFAAFGYGAGAWDAATGEKLFTIDHETIVSSLAVSPDGLYLATTGEKNTRIWNAKTGAPVHQFTHKLNGGEVSFNAHSASLLLQTTSISDGSSLELYDVASGKKISTLIEAKKEAKMGMFSPNGKWVLSCADDDTLAKLWDAGTGKLITLLNHGNYSGISSGLFSSDGKTLLTRGSSISLWQLPEGNKLQYFSSGGYSFNSFTLSRNGNMMIASAGNEAMAWNLSRQLREYELRGDAAPIESITFTPDQRRLITNNRAGNFQRLWDLRTGDMLFMQLYSEPDAERFVYSPSYKKLFIDYKYPRSAELFDTENGVRLTLDDRDPIIRWAFSQDDKYLVTADIEQMIKLWDTETGMLVRIFDGKHQKSIDDLMISLDDKKIIVTDLANTMVIWDLHSGKEIARHVNFHKDVSDLTLIPGSHWMISEQYSGLLKMWNLSTGQLHATLAGHKEPGWKFILTPDGKRLVTQGLNERFVKIWDVASGTLITDLRHVNDIKEVQLTTDGKYLVASSSFDPTIMVWDASTGALVQKLPGGARSTSTLLLTQDNKAFTRGFLDTVVHYWDLVSGQHLAVFGGHNEMINSVVYDAGRKRLLTTSSRIISTDISTGESLVLGTKGGPDFTTAVSGQREGTIVAASSDHTVQLWDTNRKSVLQTFFPVGKGDYFSSVEGGYYKASPGATKKLHYVTEDLRPVSFEQMDVKYNRPDMVLQKAGYPDTALISSYRKAYEKRISKLGVDTSAFASLVNFPVMEIVEGERINMEQTTEKLVLHIKGSDETLGLASFNIWINETPVFGAKGKKLARPVKQLDEEITITLSEGMNIIEVSATNTKGIESFRSPVKVNYRPSTPEQQNIYFIGIGINQFRDTSRNLAWSVKDIRDLSAAMIRKYEGKTVQVDTLFDENVTAENIKGLRAKLEKTTVNDIVILSYSGHGLLDNNYNYYLSTFGVDFKNPQINGLPYEELERLLDSIPARKKLMMIDACHSGEVDKEEVARYTFVEKTKADTGDRSGRKPLPLDTKLGMKSSFELMQELFVNVSRNTGTTVISAAGGMQFAQEKGELQNGVFTFAVLEFMKSRYQATTVTDLKNYVNRRVPELTKGLQVPTTRSETKAVDWFVWE